jgi:hypothetical protein
MDALSEMHRPIGKLKALANLFLRGSEDDYLFSVLRTRRRIWCDLRTYLE